MTLAGSATLTMKCPKEFGTVRLFPRQIAIFIALAARACSRSAHRETLIRPYVLYRGAPNAYDASLVVLLCPFAHRHIGISA